MTWTPPEALVERVAKEVRRAQFQRTRRTVFDETVPPTAAEIHNARAALDASPIGELVEALHDLLDAVPGACAALARLNAAKPGTYVLPHSNPEPISAAALEASHACRWPDSRVDLARLFDAFAAAAVADERERCAILARKSAQAHGHNIERIIRSGENP